MVTRGSKPEGEINHVTGVGHSESRISNTLFIIYLIGLDRYAVKFLLLWLATSSLGEYCYLKFITIICLATGESGSTPNSSLFRNVTWRPFGWSTWFLLWFKVSCFFWFFFCCSAEHPLRVCPCTSRTNLSLGHPLPFIKSSVFRFL